MVEKIRVGVIGMGMGRHHASRYHESPLGELAAICDADPIRLAQFQVLYPKAAAYTDYRAMLADGKLDAVSVALPNFLHAEVATAAMRAGSHVLCEKPMAMNAQEAEAMLRVSHETGKKLMIHFNYRFSPPSQFLKRYVSEGHLGRIYYAKTHWLRARGIPQLGGWFGIKKMSGGGPVIDLGVHRLDLAMWLMDYPKAISVSASTFDLLGAELAQRQRAQYDVEDLAVALIRLENGATLNLEVSWAGGTDKQEDMLTALYGTGGAVIQRNRGEGYDFEALALRDIAGYLTQVNPRLYPRDCPSAIDHFLECIAQNCAPEASAENGVEMMRIIDAIFRSAAEKREVQL